jgi:heme/copper-type cytochrome/quinol oxidase subunit 3
MFNHRIVFIGAWITLVIGLVIFPGFEAMGLVMGLCIGGWPFLFLSEHLLDTLIVVLIIFVLSGATVGFCACFMDKANMTRKIWVLLIASMIAGAAFLTVDSISFEGWKSLPAIEAAMESPEVNYQPTRFD